MRHKTKSTKTGRIFTFSGGVIIPLLLLFMGNYSSPDIAVSGNGNAITHNNFQYSETNHTDFGLFKGNFPASQQTIDLGVRTFTVANNGSATLSITNVQVVNYSSNLAEFAITQNLPASISTGSSANLIVKYTRKAFGVGFAAVKITTNDPDTPEFTLYLKAENQFCADCFNTQQSGASCESCASGYFNHPDCDQYQCFGKDPDDSTVCTGRGTCIGPDQCDCQPQFTGPQCNQCKNGGFFPFC